MQTYYRATTMRRPCGRRLYKTRPSLGAWSSDFKTYVHTLPNHSIARNINCRRKTHKFQVTRNFLSVIYCCRKPAIRCGTVAIIHTNNRASSLRASLHVHLVRLPFFASGPCFVPWLRQPRFPTMATTQEPATRPSINDILWPFRNRLVVVGNP